MKHLIIIIIALYLTACADSGQPSLQVLNKRCAQGKTHGQYLVRLDNKRLKKIYASSTKDLFLKIESENLKPLAIDYNFIHKTKNFNSDLKSVNNENGVRITEYGQNLIGANQLWGKNIFGEGVKIAVIDTGVDINHDLLKNQILINQNELGLDEDKNNFIGDTHGWDFVNNSPLISDLQGHGTAVASIISTEHLLDLRVGVSPKAKILPITALTPNEAGDDASAGSDLLVKAVDYARAMKVDIINASWGGNNCSKFLRESIKKATDDEILFVTASGNDGENIDINLEFPSSFNLPFVISVGGIDAFGQRVESSNFGSTVDFFAPGIDIFSLRRGSGHNFAFTKGTSVAAPFISGALALLKSAFPLLSNTMILDALKSSNDESQVPFLPIAYKNLLLKD